MKRWETCVLLTIVAFIMGCSTQNPGKNQTAQYLSPEEHKEMLRRNPMYRQAIEGKIVDYKTSTRQFLERIQGKRSAKELQAWALKMLKVYGGKDEPFDLPDDQIPDFVKILDPSLKPVVTIFPGSHLRFDWGGGWGHWGLTIGEINFHPSNEIVYFLEWSPGVFAYHTLQ